jgi:hypothetical protein
MDDKATCILNLVDALDQCGTLANRRNRDLTVELLVDPIPTKIPRSDNRNDDLQAIVSTCCDHGVVGIDSLVEAVYGREKDSVHMPRVRQCAEALKTALERELGGGRIGSTELSRGREVGQLEARYALSIGISKYVKFKDKEQKEPLTNPFRDLDFAAEDAQAFHEFLRQRGYRGPEEPLLNEKATRAGVMRALDDLWKTCRGATNPLVLIFFSGHGARDADGRHYLVPHDGDRDDLFATALWSRTFESFLRLFEHTRLVVFLDACHAEGMETHGTKGELQPDPQKLLEDRPQGSYVVASCLANQVSREYGSHGIFSNQLLRILRCEKEEDFEEEEIDLYGLVEKLKERVKEVTDGLPGKPSQEPWSNAKTETGIILAINMARREARQKRERGLLEAVNRELRNRKHQQSEVLWVRLENFIRGRFLKDPKPLEMYFRQRAAGLNGAPPSLELVREVCEALDLHLEVEDEKAGRRISYYSRDSLGAAAPHPALARPEPQQPQATVRQAITPSRTPAAAFQNVSDFLPAKHPSMPIGLPTSAESPQGRCLRSDDVSYLLENIRKRATKYKFTGRIARLKELLTRSSGMSEKEFRSVLDQTCSDGDPLWADLVDELGERFESRWPNAFKPGAWACSPHDLDLSLLAHRLRQPDRSVDEFVAGRLPPEVKDALAEYLGEDSDRRLERALVCCLNTLIHGPSIWNEKRFEGIELRQDTAHIRSRNTQGANLEQLNRMLLEDAYPKELRKLGVADQLSLRRGRASGDQGDSNA